MAWLTLFAVLAAAMCLVLVERWTGRAAAEWVRTTARQVNPAAYQQLAEADQAEAEPDLASLESVPEPLRPLCPAPPFVAAIYHHTCGSCRELWRQIDQAADLASVHMVHSAGQVDFLRRRGVLRQPAIAFPDELMALLPSGLALRVEADWRITGLGLANSTEELRQLIGESVRSR